MKEDIYEDTHRRIASWAIEAGVMSPLGPVFTFLGEEKGHGPVYASILDALEEAARGGQEEARELLDLIAELSWA